MRAQVCQLQLLGRGGQAVVLRGVWQLADVAVKLVVANPASTPPSTLAKLLLEGPLSKRLRAPNVVETYCYSVTRLTTDELRVCQVADDVDDEEEEGHGQGGLCCGSGCSSCCGCTGVLQSGRSLPSGIFVGEAEEEKLQEFLTEHGHREQHHQHLRPSVPHQKKRLYPGGPRGRCPFEDSATALVEPHLLRSFDSFDGFGPSPSGRRSAASTLRYSEALSAAGAAPGCFLTQIVMELCDQGSLADAVAKGAYAKAACDRAALFAYLRTLYDIAAGMSYLHSNGVIHGDLKPGNVLLRSSRADPRGYQAKVSDFGLSLCTATAAPPNDDTGSQPAEEDWSSHPYMAPEHFDGRLVMASDVWAFAATAHHLWTGRLPHAGLHPLQVCAGVFDGSLRLQAPPGMPRQLAGLLSSCMARDCARRPSFPQIRGALRELEAELCGV